MGVELNAQFVRALKALEAGANVFITGKAGTGKSTLLRHFIETSAREAVVAAPTGVAALNVRGQTIHRLFRFGGTVTPEHVASRNYSPRHEAREVLASMRTLVLDEVSMVRADLMDCVDIALRRFGPVRDAPFGGVQMVFVGDPYQLPPVVIGAEGAHFRSRYATPYFFSADALRDYEYEVIELDRVYRQQDLRFVALLNAIRTGEASEAVFDALNERYDPDFVAPDGEFWVTLATTNRLADSVNNRRLAALPTDLVNHLASVKGEVQDADKPVPDQLGFKIGAQVMCVANDVTDQYANGSMGVVSGISSCETNEVSVTIDLQNGPRVSVTPHTWEVTRPVLEGGRLSYEVIGSYRQLPFKLAWAVTIHKSQGKTLERAIVSLGRGTFAEGQLYVALSRCTSLDGLVLHSKVRSHHVKVEREVTRFLARGKAAPVRNSDQSGLAFVAVHATGVDRHDRVVEIGVVIERGGCDLEEYSTFVNPLRDIGRAPHGITASDVEMAPTFVEAWPWIARRMDGCVVVGHGLPLIQTMIEREAETSGNRVDLGLGIDVMPLAPGDLLTAAQNLGLFALSTSSALDCARLTRAIYREVAPKAGLKTAPFRSGPAAERLGWIRGRTAVPSSFRGTGQLAYSDMVAVVIAGDLPVQEATAAIERAALQTHVSLEDSAEVKRALLDAVVDAARRDRSMSDREGAAIKRAATLLNLPVPRLGDTQHSSRPVLVAGARVCFTGAASDLDGAPIERSVLESIAEQNGLIPVSSVTRNGCDVVVAGDPTSMSGKAKKAREYGIPVASVKEFLTWTHHAG